MNKVVVFLMVITLSILAACGENIPTATPFLATETNTPFFVTSTIDPNKPTSTPSPVPSPSFAPSITPTSTQDIWLNTAVAFRSTEIAITHQAEDNKATQVAQFPVACEGVGSYASGISPDGEWIATTCGYSRDQTLVVQNKGGAKWVLEFKDFLSKDSLQYGVPMGSLYSNFWSPDGTYLYFVPIIGYDGGGSPCFPGFGSYGLFRLNLKKGSWVTLIPPTDSFVGYAIDFSPTGRRYATDINGVTITDLKTGNVSRIDVSDTVEGLIWSPDGTQLVFTSARCDEEQWTLQSSSVYVWDALRNEKRVLFTTDEVVLRPESWIDDSNFRVSGEKIVGSNMVYTIYVFNATENNIVFTGTATPNP